MLTDLIIRILRRVRILNFAVWTSRRRNGSNRLFDWLFYRPILLHGDNRRNKRNESNGDNRIFVLIWNLMIEWSLNLIVWGLILKWSLRRVKTLNLIVQNLNLTGWISVAIAVIFRKIIVSFLRLIFVWNWIVVIRLLICNWIKGIAFVFDWIVNIVFEHDDDWND